MGLLVQRPPFFGSIDKMNGHKNVTVLMIEVFVRQRSTARRNADTAWCQDKDRKGEHVYPR